ncbi:S28 family serine protease [Streptomonospora wellingtoniae]|uniref:S28 family serine protease n=1 Tax=Streptomonospora wellingtoniae TaxID=3075544 RepID=A0ABU2KTS6_9ACTN|nr:S28 family serine protease [Streptomonospora sp. DSM 45055]MDT0302689.1 S28 family serine protease [Streptomonospora sp. DSM 45055]
MTPRTPHSAVSWRAAAGALLTATALLFTAAPASADPAPTDIADRLEAVPGLRIIEETETEPGFRHFVLGYEQPADHGDADGRTFEQRLTLLHRGFDRPTVLHTSGYNVSVGAFRSEPARILDANQISTEQRFFEPSRPDPADWDDLDIRQAAADHHRLVEALNDIYRQEWISTGASKGGMTSVYHRRFYPDDIDGTVAYVAPNDVVDREDHAYRKFFRTVGDDPQCQDDLEGLQHEALERRGELVDHYTALAQKNDWTFDRTLGSADRAFEILVLDTAWAFWQYQPYPEACADVPAPDASTEEIAAFLDDVAGFSFYTDQGTLPYIPYYFQAATQLGTPSVPTGHLDGLLRYPGLFQARSYLPDEMDVPRFDRWAMPDVDHWVSHRSERMLFVDGEYDPWGAEHFRAGSAKRDTMRFVAPGANHGADIAALADADRAKATEALKRWAGVGDEAAAMAEGIPELDDAGERRAKIERGFR